MVAFNLNHVKRKDEEREKTRTYLNKTNLTKMISKKSLRSARW
jgi:hypothetical protein